MVACPFVKDQTKVGSSVFFNSLDQMVYNKGPLFAMNLESAMRDRQPKGLRSLIQLLVKHNRIIETQLSCRVKLPTPWLLIAS